MQNKDFFSTNPPGRFLESDKKPYVTRRHTTASRPVRRQTFRRDHKSSRAPYETISAGLGHAEYTTFTRTFSFFLNISETFTTNTNSPAAATGRNDRRAFRFVTFCNFHFNDDLLLLIVLQHVSGPDRIETTITSRRIIRIRFESPNPDRKLNRYIKRTRRDYTSGAKTILRALFLFFA